MPYRRKKFTFAISSPVEFLLHQMFNVSVLLLDDALLKCVVTEVVLFSIAFKTLDTLRGRSRAGAVRSGAVGAVAVQTGPKSSAQSRPKQGGIFSDSIITIFLLILKVK